jgi:hypothetical protein
MANFVSLSSGISIGDRRGGGSSKNQKKKRKIKTSSWKVCTCALEGDTHILPLASCILRTLEAQLDTFWPRFRSICQFHWTDGTKELVAYHL